MLDRSGSFLDRSAYALEIEDAFEGDRLDERCWIPGYLPHWTTPARAATRHHVGGGRLTLRIDVEQPAWAPDLTGAMRVSSLQTGRFSGPVGSGVGQHRFRDGLVVRTADPPLALYTPRYGLFELEARFSDDATTMSAFWMIGYEDAPERSGEICIAEIFGRDVGPDRVGIGMGIHPFHDPKLRDEFRVESVAIDARERHRYAAEWTPKQVAFFVDDRLIKVVQQSPAYPMQVMLDIFEFRTPEGPVEAAYYPKTFVVEAFRGWRPRDVDRRFVRAPAGRAVDAEP